MYETGEAILFFIVFASQVLLISWLYPRRVFSRRRLVLQNYPPSTHPKMYLQPIEYYERRLRNYARLNHAIVVAGFLIIVGLALGTLGAGWSGAIVTPWSPSGEWDAALVPFFLVQWIGALYYELSMLKHNKARAQAAPPRVRTTELRRRRLFDFVSPAMLIAAVLANVAYVAFVLWYRRFGFSWFTAAGNIVLIAVMVVMMGAVVAITLRAPRPDHYQAHQDRLELMRLVVNQAVGFSIAFPVVFAIQLIVKLYDPDFLEPVVASLATQIVSLAWLGPAYRYRVDKIDFDVYKQDARDSKANASTTIGSASSAV